MYLRGYADSLNRSRKHPFILFLHEEALVHEHVQRLEREQRVTLGCLVEPFNELIAHCGAE